MSLRLRPSRITAQRRIEEGYQLGVWEIICPDCGDAGGDFRDVPRELQAVRGPYFSEEDGLTGLKAHIGLTVGS